jgi:hypothetical protein
MLCFKKKQDGFLKIDKTLDNVQKHITCSMRKLIGAFWQCFSANDPPTILTEDFCGFPQSPCSVRMVSQTRLWMLPINYSVLFLLTLMQNLACTK